MSRDKYNYNSLLPISQLPGDFLLPILWTSMAQSAGHTVYPYSKWYSAHMRLHPGKLPSPRFLSEQSRFAPNDSGHHKVQEHIVLPTDPTPPAYTPESEQSHPALVPTGHIAASAGQECESLLPAHRPFRNRPATYSNR